MRRLLFIVLAPILAAHPNPGVISTHPLPVYGPSRNSVSFNPRLEVDYAGSAPTQLCGIVQINMRIPATARPGDFWFSPSAVSSTANSTNASGGTVAVKIPVK